MKNMQANKKTELYDDLSCQGFSRHGLVRPKRLTYTQQLYEQNDGVINPHENRIQTPEKKVFKTNPKKMLALGQRARVGKTGNKTMTPLTMNSINKYRIQIRKFIQNIEEYKKLEGNLKSTHDNLISMRKELLNSMDVEPGEIPDVHSSLQNLLHDLLLEVKQTNEQTRLQEVENECIEIKKAFIVIEEEKKKLEETLDILSSELKGKEEELSRVTEIQHRHTMKHLSGEGDSDDIGMLNKTIITVDKANGTIADELKRQESDCNKAKDELKVRSLEKLIESLHVEIKNLKDQLKVEKECRHNLETVNDKLGAEINELKSISSSSDSKYVILEKDQKIQELQNRLSEISRIRPHGSSTDVFKVDFSADTPSLITQLAKFVQLYEEVAREGFDLESKLKDAHLEIYRLEQILEKQLAKIKEQDECLNNMEESLHKVVAGSKKSSRADVSKQFGQCKCSEFEILIREKEEFSESLKEKMKILYQKYKQYKSECNLMKKKLEAIEKKSWLKKLVNI